MGGLSLFLLTGCFASAPEPIVADSFLYQPAFCEDHLLRGPARPYHPRPGDLMFAADNSKFWTFMHKLAGTSHPTHSGIVFLKPDGSTGILEAGPYDTLRVRTLDAIPHLKNYEEMGRVWLRARKTPITPEQSAALTAWAMAQDGKRFAICRLGQQLTPLSLRGPVRTHFVAHPRGDRNNFFCSELVMESLVASGLFDAKYARPAATYPRDIFLEESPNPYLNKHLKLPCWDPPARWVSSAEACVDGK